MTTDIQTMERIEKQKRDLIHQEVVVANKEKNRQFKTTLDFNKAKDIYKSSSGLDNISAFDMATFRKIMLG